MCVHIYVCIYTYISSRCVFLRCLAMTLTGMYENESKRKAQYQWYRHRTHHTLAADCKRNFASILSLSYLSSPFLSYGLMVPPPPLLI